MFCCVILLLFGTLCGFTWYITSRCDSKCSVKQSVLEINNDHEDTMKTSMCFHGKRFQLLKSISRVFKDFLIARHFSRV